MGGKDVQSLNSILEKPKEQKTISVVFAAFNSCRPYAADGE